MLFVGDFEVVGDDCRVDGFGSMLFKLGTFSTSFFVVTLGTVVAGRFLEFGRFLEKTLFHFLREQGMGRFTVG